jgi:hypothetical protein
MPRPILATRRLSTIPPGREHPTATRSKAAAITLSKLVLSNCGQEPCCWPSLFVGPFGKVGPEDFDGRQAQFVEQHAEFGSIDSRGVPHAASSR